MRTIFLALPLLALSGSLGATALSGQNVTVDEGTFTIFIDGRAVGTESFTIRRSGSGQDARILAQAMIEMDLPSGQRSVVPLLEATGPEMGVSAYQVDVSGDRTQEIKVTHEGRRFVANIRSSAGEQQREFRAREGALLLEEGVAHQYYFLRSVADAGAGSVSVLVPLAGDQKSFAVTDAGTESIQVGGQSVNARHLRLEAGGDIRHVWMDPQGRVLRVEVPASDYRAERQALPN